MWLILLALAALLPWVRVLYNGWQAQRLIPKLKDLPAPAYAAALPKLSVVVAARNEERHIEQALRSLAAQTHHNLEIIVVNDRSTDQTGAIIERLAGEYGGRIKPVTVEELPEGWLGKCHALQTGADAAQGDYILFADADVEFAPDVLVRAHAYALAEQADQFTVIPETVADSFWEHAMLNVFALCFFLGFPPHKALRRNSGGYIGVGAFNMVSTAMYRRIQGHRFLRLQVVDDVGLGKLIKFSGGRVRVAMGVDEVRVRWQEDLAATIKGLEKNFFASTNYSVALTVAMVVGVLIVFVWPWVGLWVGPATARWICGAALALQVITGAAAATRARFSPVHGLTAQAGAVLLIVAMVRSMVVTLKQGGIRWRDSFYPLAELKKFKL